MISGRLSGLTSRLLPNSSIAARGLAILPPWQAHFKDCTTAFARAADGTSAVPLGDAPYQGEAKTNATLGAFARPRGSIERLKDALAFGFGDAWPAVRDAQNYGVFDRRNFGLDRTARSVPPGIFQQIAHQSPQQLLIAHQGHWRTADRNAVVRRLFCNQGG